jgi:hypothetical protein
MSGSVSGVALEEAYQGSLNSERHFPNKRILHIGSESYDAQTVAVCQGLDRLGFEIYVPVKPNINSWFCNKVIRNPRQYKFDFVLSSLHWGTRWSHYGRYGLWHYPKVLIDGDDNMPGDTWRTKFDRYLKTYKVNPPNEVKALELAPYRWVESLDGYKPDVVFALAKYPGAYYIPKGLQHQWLDQNGSKTIMARGIDFCHVPGPGAWRRAMSALLVLGVLPGTIHNEAVRGKPAYPTTWVRSVAERDAGIHSWDRWAMYTDFYRILDDTRVLIHPGIDHWPFWEARRIYEGWACGCLVAMSTPTVDVSEYPPTGVCPEAVYASHEELISKGKFWYENPDILDSLAVQSAARARRYFSPVAVARYFLKRVHDAISH